MSSNRQPEIRFSGFIGDWEESKLIELGNLNRGKSKHRPRNDPRLYGGKYPFIQTGDVAKANLFLDNYRQTYSEFGIQQSKLWNKGTLLITIAANIAETSILSIDAAFPDSVIGFESTRVDMVFIKNVIDNAANYLKRKAETSSQANLNLAKLSELSLVIPSLKEQQKIGTFFKQLDDTIALHQRELDLLKETKKGFLQKMFPKNGAKVPEIRFPGFTEDWEERKLGEFLIVPQNIKADVRSTDDLMTVKLNLGGVSSGSNRETLSLGSTAYYERRAGQFIYGKQNFFNGSMAIIPEELDGKATSGDVPALNIININTQYLYVYISRTEYWRRKEAAASGTGSKRIHESVLQGFEIDVPTDKEQQKIGTFFKQLDDTITLHQRKLDLLKETKKGFLQKMFV